jgi:hypothetical protein
MQDSVRNDLEVNRKAAIEAILSGLINYRFAPKRRWPIHIGERQAPVNAGPEVGSEDDL